MPEKSLKNVMERVLEIVAHPTQILNNNFQWQNNSNTKDYYYFDFAWHGVLEL